jgi:hypothetical protein
MPRALFNRVGAVSPTYGECPQIALEKPLKQQQKGTMPNMARPLLRELGGETMNTSFNPQDSDQKHEEELTSAVLGYLAENPRAMDTLEGIAEWWITRQLIRVEVTTLARVLRRLTERGLLEVTGTGEYARYSLKRERHEP